MNALFHCYNHIVLFKPSANLVIQGQDIQAGATTQIGATTQAEATANKCTCKIEEDIWDLDEANAILNARCIVCKIGINEIINSSAIKIENEAQPAEDDFEEITLEVNVSTSATKIENEIQSVEDDFKEITLDITNPSSFEIENKIQLAEDRFEEITFEVINPSIKIENEIQPVEDDFEEITLDINTPPSIKIESEIQPAEDGFEEIILGDCLTCNGPARACNCPDANLQLPFDHELDDSGFVDDSLTTVVQRKIRTLDFEVDDIFDLMSDGCTEIFRRLSYKYEPNERVDIQEAGYTFVDHHKK